MELDQKAEALRKLRLQLNLDMGADAVMLEAILDMHSAISTIEQLQAENKALTVKIITQGCGHRDCAGPVQDVPATQHQCDWCEYRASLIAKHSSSKGEG